MLKNSKIGYNWIFQIITGYYNWAFVVSVVFSFEVLFVCFLLFVVVFVFFGPRDCRRMIFSKSLPV